MSVNGVKIPGGTVAVIEMPKVETRLAENRIPIDVQAILFDIHQQLSEENWCSMFTQGWKTLKNKSSSCTITCYKVSFAAGGTFATMFILGSTMFGCLAMQQALHEIEEDGRGAIIGHFSEWTTQAFFASMVSLRFPYDITRLGHQPKIDELFDPQIADATLPREDQVVLYKEKIKAQENLTQQSSLFMLPNLPNPGAGAIALEQESPDLISIDLGLRQTYEEIEEQINVSGFQLVQKGWEEYYHRKSCCTIGLLKTAVVATGVALLAQYTIYSLGIYWSAEEAVEDFQNGDNPSIGGHCLEWFAEMIAVGNLVYNVVGEISNIGAVRVINKVFQRHIDTLKEEKPIFWEQKINRLKDVLHLQLRRIPQGYFFTLPSYLEFRPKPEGNPGLDADEKTESEDGIF